jgi:hypothetical protein
MKKLFNKEKKALNQISKKNHAYIDYIKKIDRILKK